MVVFINNFNINYQVAVNHINNRKESSVLGFCDTGCTTTSLNIEALSRLLNIRKIILIAEIKSRLSNGYPIIYTNIANGTKAESILISINNVHIGSVVFDKLNCLLNLSDIDDNVGGASPLILIGLDVLRSFSSVVMDKDRIVCKEFDKFFYESMWSKTGKLWTVYMNMPIEESNSLGLAASLPDII